MENIGAPVFFVLLVGAIVGHFTLCGLLARALHWAYCKATKGPY
jgi:hypothetical protein